MDTIRIPHEFKEFLKLLISNKVEYMLVGGIVVGYYGYPRATGDMDVWVNNSPENSIAVAALLRGYGLELPENFPDMFCRERKVFRIGMPPLRIEILNRISGVEFQDCTQRCNHILIDGDLINIIGLEDLKKNKSTSARTNDLDDLANLP